MADGIYWEIVYLRDQDNITIKSISGNRDAVNIQYDNADKYNGGVNDGMDISQFAPLGTAINDGNRSVITIGGNADKIRFENVTIENAYGWTQGQNGQAEAIIIRNDNGATAFINCRILSYQDTLLPGGGYNWFYNCYIAGGTDFIWGSGKVVLFEDCELHAPTGTRAVMQARVTEGDLGYVFDRCRFTVGTGYQSTLIWQYKPDNLTFLNCTFADTYGQNFVGENKPLVPNQPTVTEGCKMYGCTNESGAEFYNLIPEAVRATVLNLTDEQFEQNFGSREKIMSWGGNTDASWFQE